MMIGYIVIAHIMLYWVSSISNLLIHVRFKTVLYQHKGVSRAVYTTVFTQLSTWVICRDICTFISSIQTMHCLLPFVCISIDLNVYLIVCVYSDGSTAVTPVCCDNALELPRPCAGPWISSICFGVWMRVSPDSRLDQHDEVIKWKHFRVSG